MDTLKIRVIMEYEYRRGSNAAQAAHNINDVYGANTTNADITQSTAELAAAFDVSVKTILVHLRQNGKVKKLDKWVPHELNDRQREVRIETCLVLLNRHTNEGILNRIVTCDEKWILFDNRKRSASWLDPGSAVIHHSFLPNGVSITADIYCEELNTMMEKLAHLQPELVNRSSPLHDNARPHTAQQTVSKLQKLGLEALRHPPYSPDLAPTDYYSFRNLDNFMKGKKFNTREAVQNAFEEFIASRPADFFKESLKKGINKLSVR
ncbi:histone-lysine N-methyltransferase SETMAR-like [Leptidea sinapis]|uniref:histone-lysine N-methyltransferase SETMAR-like n=1 Tax=Leptidea sinapis TaxID=189913 RepID=UPI0021C337C6|nr:histone-lysine N-methyltransferase SETMAR-like [Leptidea sinapis]